jgi:ribosomal protein L18E
MKTRKRRMISQTKLKARTKRKTDSILVDTITEARKNREWNEVAKLLSSSTKRQSSVNLFDIDRQTSAGDTVVIVGKVLSGGELSKKVRICALSISEKANKKLKDNKSEFATIFEEINKNKKAEGIKLLQ